MSESIFVAEGDTFVPTEHARGPWDPGALHGGAPAALIAAAFERMQPGEELPIARMSFEFLRPIPMAPLTLSTRITRPGRRVQALTAEIEAGGEVVCRASALRILPSPSELPESALAQVRVATSSRIAAPDDGDAVVFALDDSDRRSFAASAIEMRFLSGHPLVGELPELDTESRHVPTGAATVWMRLRHPLLPGQAPSPIARVAAAADFGNGVAAAVPFDRYLFINADLSITLDRSPVGEWIALEARTLLHPGGIAWAESVLHDERGPLGLARQALVVQPRLGS
ncbi:MAG TPA: thioesterase family protein [Solirubrobacteraceae bacterium]|nr:thioesterase family protein [Solirubrobacteraceae bacterium]